MVVNRPAFSRGEGGFIDFLTKIMYLKLNKDIVVESTSISSYELDGCKIILKNKNHEKSLGVYYGSNQEAKDVFNGLNSHFKPKDLLSQNNSKINMNDEKESSFNLFWELYDKKVGMQNCKKKFMKFSMNTIKEILKSTPEYIKKTPNVRYRKNPLTWLNGKHWEDDYDEMWYDEIEYITKM